MFVLVWKETPNVPVIPIDDVPGCGDEESDHGMLVYRTRRVAELAAQHQTHLYGEEVEDVAIVRPLGDWLRENEHAVIVSTEPAVNVDAFRDEYTEAIGQEGRSGQE